MISYSQFHLYLPETSLTVLLTYLRNVSLEEVNNLRHTQLVRSNLVTHSLELSYAWQSPFCLFTRQKQLSCLIVLVRNFYCPFWVLRTTPPGSFFFSALPICRSKSNYGIYNLNIEKNKQDKSSLHMTKRIKLIVNLNTPSGDTINEYLSPLSLILPSWHEIFTNFRGCSWHL